jgi:rubrerythrin
LYIINDNRSSKIPNHKAEKANRSEQKHYDIFQQWREKAQKAIVKKTQPEKTYNSEIERYKQELDGMRKNHELMKAGNIAIKKHIKKIQIFRSI